MLKVQARVPFDVLLSVGQCAYYLTGLIVHQGEMDGGHYVSYVRCNSGEWCLFDDAEVHLSRSEAEVLQQQAYIFFYHKL